jgi:hypothetical protein
LDRQLNENEAYMKFALLITYTFAACAHPADPRDNSDSTEDETLAYITETIFLPYCATAECHSTFKQASIPGGEPIVLDTVEHAQNTLQSQGMLECSARGTVYDPCDLDADSTGSAAYGTYLGVITGEVGMAIGNGVTLRMPYDQALPDKDYRFMIQWIADGADGYTPNPGTQQ